LLLSCKEKKILFVDFDTQFSSYFQDNNILKYDKSEFPNLKVVLPNIKNIEFTIKEMVNSLTCDSILIIDSLNGLIDSLNMFNLYKLRNNKTTADTTTPRPKSGGYQSLNILSLLLKKIENKKIPIVITLYQPLERSKKMVNELLGEINDLEKNNHILRISSTAIFLEFNEGICRTGLTIMKNKPRIISPSSHPSSHPSTPSPNPFAKIFFPYSRWFYHNFIKL